jgi:glyoxylase-like metal-dependent hydrolase (beta-lactamase superfamily II)
MKYPSRVAFLMIQLDILAVGDLVRAEDGSILKADSTSVLVRAGGRTIVVDPSTKYMRPAVKTSFRQIGVFPKDVDTVILTHSHRDHIENLDLYQNAEVLIHSGSDAEIAGAKAVDGGEIKICPGVRMVHTPGHCPEHCSVFVDSDRHYAIAGDAVPLEDNFRRMIPPRLNTDPSLALQSIKNIGDYADVVIPGHGFPFMTDR